MKRNTAVSAVDFSQVAARFKPMEAEDFKNALCQVVGKCAERSLSEYKDAIAAAAGCVQVHFGLDPMKVGVPLITLLVGAMQLSDTLAGSMDLEDAARFTTHIKDSVRPMFAGIGDGEYTLPEHGWQGKEQLGEQLWAFVAGQAIAVLRGEFDDKGEDLDKVDAIFGPTRSHN